MFIPRVSRQPCGALEPKPECFQKRVQGAQEVVDKALSQKAVHEAGVAEGERRLATLQAEAAQPVPVGISHVAELQQQIDAMVRERDAMRASPVKDGKWTGNGPSHAENIPAMATDRRDLEGWLSDRNCELRNVMEFGEVGLVVHIGGLVGQGATQLGLLGRDRDVPMEGQSRSALMSSLIDDQAKRRCLGPGAAALAIQS